ncbi:MAG: hypothetical protein Q7R73_01595 [bacterium]|nr:hypothetical protein [bacterium]
MNIKRYSFVIIALIAFAFVVSADHSWGNYHWARTSNPFTLKVGDNVSSAWDSYLDEAVADWSASSVLNLVRVAGSTNPRSCKAKAGQIQACSERYGNTGWLGIAQIWVSGSHITKAVTKVNDTYFNTPDYNTPAWRRLVMCQEIAHDFGLDHQDEDFDNANLGSCMDYTSDPDGPPSNEHPNAHDFEQLEIIYAHLDSTNTVFQPKLGGGNSANGVDPAAGAEWGRIVRRAANGKPSLYEHDLGGGEKVFTFVIWAQ